MQVDAALDLSHTANIGRMIREHFAGAQFIVVSLKEGMFTNANVIFRTRFVDGSSTVIRTLGTGHSESARKGGDSQKPAAKRACVGTAEEQENRVLQS
jgi:structural maintenance of chromosome 2